MKRLDLILLGFAGLAGTFLAPAAQADPIYKRTQVTFSQPVEIPGMVLAPGTYVIKLLDPYTSPNVVRFYNAQENHMYAMVFAIPDYRLTPADHTVITFEERAHNSPQAIKEWFPPGENWGEEFVYPKPKPIASSVEPESPKPLQPRAAVTPAPLAPEARTEAPPARTAQVQPEQPRVEIAQAQPAPAANTPAAPAGEQLKQLPKTASDLPTVALVGGALTLLGAAMRRRIA